MTDTPAPSQPPQMLITYHNGLYCIDVGGEAGQRLVHPEHVEDHVIEWMLKVEAAQ
jgi:hypothetical protein